MVQTPSAVQKTQSGHVLSRLSNEGLTTHPSPRQPNVKRAGLARPKTHGRRSSLERSGDGCNRFSAHLKVQAASESFVAAEGCLGGQVER